MAAEFFAGVGLVRMGLEAAGFEVAWSNDIDRDKHDMYRRHFGDRPGHAFALGDVREVGAADLPDPLDLAWASFPCTDLSVAGWRRGLEGEHSGTFWEFARVLEDMGTARPPVVALENVVGFASSHGGEDIRAAAAALNRLGYSIDALAIDARRFVPQSRPRLFLIGCQDVPTSATGASELRPALLDPLFADPTLRTHRALLPEPPPLRRHGLSGLMELLDPEDERWWDAERTARFLSALSPLQAERLRQLRALPTDSFRTAYRRTRNGLPMWEIRPDDIAGCLRTARGGSSKQAVVQAGAGVVRVRWMTGREYARLMGAGEYRIEGVRPNQALFGFGDAVCVPVAQWLAENYLHPAITRRSALAVGA